MLAKNGGPNAQLEQVVLLPFDDLSIPFRYCLECGLVPATNPYKAHTRVMGRGAHRVYVNADGLSKASFLRAEVVDERFKPIPGYSGSDCVPVNQSRLRQPVSWTGGEVIENLDHLIRVKVSWQGTRPEDLHLYAVYVSEGDLAGKERP